MLSFKSVLIVITSFLICSCDDRFRPLEHLVSYHEALARSKLIQLEELETDSHLSLLRLPDLRDRTMPLSKFDIGLLEFLSLQRCDVGLVAGERNSILGRVMPSSQRFLYELKIIKAIEQCTIENESLMTKLQGVVRTKRAELPKAFANAMWSGEEAAGFFSLSNGMISMSPERSQYQALVSTFSELVIIGENLQTLPNLSNKVFEAYLKVMLDSEYGGRLLVTLQVLATRLEYATNAIEAVDVNAANCQAPIAYLKQQFTKYYIKIIQPYMARVNRVAYQVLPNLKELGNVASEEPEALKRFFSQFDENTNTVWGRYKQASIRHAQAWSHLFEQCGISLKTN
ncbi:DUF3080 domain-containing protein [Marinomonas mediterranea]|jgi:Protein of unknown function (DUF3080).|uniref:DUF3080 domain-containing protein n=1 Tax=Marinomonas mediterranea (strain ATCC 700492 / JCM 21426 / NBRC 103028 / MMB-1) TaxID=717774 RepID=F2JT94_MARM1|nr:DUF3080 domain-containing protein [Marinomonas mediterranea]ADZ90312.1 hypothetical protein Marme_1037 [Marinomonas mediterranea MMB-1]WCN16501.1 DUF3080 family protein [Marinomonas mediterranea MMB-1]